MIGKVSAISQNPLEAAAQEDAQALAIERLEEEERRKEAEMEAKMKKKSKKKKKKKDDGPMETAILEQTIVKIGALLALGFGEAGSKIIAQNMENSGDVDPMIPGNKVMAIFGYCEVRSFIKATECLQEGVMIFINEIAEVVHGIVDQFSGAANKNKGDAFLLVWRLTVDEDYTRSEDEKLELIQNRRLKQICDMALISFVKITTEIRKSKKLRKYREHAQLQEFLPNYEVRLGYGLHIGWAIEGAIGSLLKIDASYLSPDVELAQKIEVSSKYFGMPIVISGDFKKNLSK